MIHEKHSFHLIHVSNDEEGNLTYFCMDCQSRLRKYYFNKNKIYR